MKYTLAQAKTRLSSYQNTLGVSDLTAAINQAIDALKGMAGWECLRKVVRFSSAGPCLTLPQGSAGLVRVCINGSPAELRGQDFRFLQSGPGDRLSRVPDGFVLVRNVEDCGTSPVMIDPTSPFKLYVVTERTTALSPESSITVKGLDTSGRIVSRTLTPFLKEATPTADAQVFQTVQEVVISNNETGYLTLYAVDSSTSDVYPIAVYHPGVKVPEFRKYYLPSVRPGQHIDVLAEVRLDPIPLVLDTDVLPFDCIEPIEWMLNYNFDMQSGEVDKALKFQQQAAQWLKSKEVTNDTIQTAVVFNSLTAMSAAEDSFMSWNI